MQFYVCEEGESIPPSVSSNTTILRCDLNCPLESLEDNLTEKVRDILLKEPWDDEDSHSEFIASNHRSYSVANNIAYRFGCPSTILH